MIKFKDVIITPQTVSTKQSFTISVSVVDNPSVFKFPLVINKLTGLIFKPKSK